MFNYFPTKEDLVDSGLEAFEEQLFAPIRGRRAGRLCSTPSETSSSPLRGFLAAKDEANAQELVALTRMIAASPALLAREQQILARTTDALATLIAKETGSSAGDVRAHVVASALIGVHRALIAYVRQRLEAGTPARCRPARDVRGRGEKRSRSSPTASATMGPSADGGRSAP